MFIKSRFYSTGHHPMNSEHCKESGNFVCCSRADIKKQQGAIKLSCVACIFMQKWCYNLNEYLYNTDTVEAYALLAPITVL